MVISAPRTLSIYPFLLFLLAEALFLIDPCSESLISLTSLSVTLYFPSTFLLEFFYSATKPTSTCLPFFPFFKCIVGSAFLTQLDIPFPCKQHIPCLEIAVDDLVAVKELQTTAHLIADIADLILRQGLFQVHHDAVNGPALTKLYIHLKNIQNSKSKAH